MAPSLRGAVCLPNRDGSIALYVTDPDCWSAWSAVSGAGTATLNGVIGGTGALTSTMTGTLVTNAQHTYAGGTKELKGRIKECVAG